MLHRAPGEHAIHAEEAATGARSGVLEIISQSDTIDAGHGNHCNDAANAKNDQSKDDAGLQLRNLETISEGIGNGGEHAISVCLKSRLRTRNLRFVGNDNLA